MSRSIFTKTYGLISGNWIYNPAADFPISFPKKKGHVPPAYAFHTAYCFFTEKQLILSFFHKPSSSITYQILNEKTWERALRCAIFRNSVEPAFCVTFEADITNFKHMVKGQGLSFTMAMVYAVCRCANNIEAFRYRFLDGQKEYFTGPLGNDVFQCSPMPWVTYTHISHTNSGKKDNATPLFDLGKYYERDGKVLIPISAQAHHSFVDGLHIGQFVEELQKFLNEC